MSSACSLILEEECVIPSPRNPVVEDWESSFRKHQIAEFQRVKLYLKQESSFALISGPMGASKSLFVLGLGEDLTQQGFSVMYTRSWVDTRTGTIESRAGARNGQTTPCFESQSEENLLEPDVLFIDEAQFVGFLPGQELYLQKMINVIHARRAQGKRTVVSLLNEDFKTEPWVAYQALIGEIHVNGGEEFKLKAVCMECGSLAEHSQRLIDDSEIVSIGGDMEYEPRCDHCHTWVKEDGLKV